MQANGCSTSSTCPAGPYSLGHGHQVSQYSLQDIWYQVLRSSVLDQYERNAVHKFNINPNNFCIHPNMYSKDEASANSAKSAAISVEP